MANVTEINDNEGRETGGEHWVTILYLLSVPTITFEFNI